MAIPKLADLGVTPDQSSKFQALADIPETEFEAAMAEVKDAGQRVTAPGARMAVHYSSARIFVRPARPAVSFVKGVDGRPIRSGDG